MEDARLFSSEQIAEQPRLVGLAPLAHANLGKLVEDRVIMTDASETGLAVSYSDGLTPLGQALLDVGSQRRRHFSLDVL